MSEKTLHGHTIRFNKETNEWEGCRVYLTRAYLWDQGVFVDRESKILVVTAQAHQYDAFQKKLVDLMIDQVRLGIEERVRDIAKGIAAKISYPKSCVCAHPPTHLANDCHEHTENPDHYFGSLEAKCEYESCYASDSEPNSPYIR